MKKIFGILGWIFVCLSMISLIGTILTNYLFVNVSYFENYYFFQACLLITMILWAVKLYDKREKASGIVTPIICLMFAVGTMFFMYVGVY